MSELNGIDSADLTPSPVISSTDPMTLPKPTRAEDLLDMYDAEEAEGAEESQDAPTEDSTKILLNKDTLPKEGTIKAKDGDAELEIPETAKFQIKIDGKDVEVTQKDAIQALVKQREFNLKIEQRLSTVARREQSTNNAFNSLIKTATKVAEFAAQGDVLGANRELAKIAANGSALDIASWERKFFDKNLEFARAYAALSPEQIDRFFFERKASLTEDELKAHRERETAQSQKSQLEQHVQMLQEQHNIQPKEFWETYKLIEDDLVGEGKVFRSVNDVRPEDVVEQVSLIRHYDKIYSAANQVGLQDEAIIDELARITDRDRDLTVDDLVNILNRSGLLTETAARQSVENLNRRAEKSRLKPKSGHSTKRDAYVDDDELMKELYKRQPRTYKQINFR